MAIITNAIPNQSEAVVDAQNRCDLRWYQFFLALSAETPVPFSQRPMPAVEGSLVPFTDSTTNVWGAVITGGGTNHVLGFFNGVAWTVAAK